MNNEQLLCLSRSVAISSPDKDITNILIATIVSAIVIEYITEEI